LLPTVDDLLATLVAGLRQAFAARGWTRPCMVGIHRGGAWIAARLHALLELPDPLGTLDISFHRDDFARSGLQPEVRPSAIPFAVDDAQIVLVDDILFTGRTIRAALNELFDYGRPDGVLLAVLVDRGGRELPFAADVVGAQVTLAPGQMVKLLGPDTLRLEIRERAR
jgi:pyrimidine operon attenuation protein / uracil phosphoribosyltransferase